MYGNPYPVAETRAATVGRVTAGRVNPWLVLVLVCLAQFMVILDATIVNVALPSIQADLGISESSLQWIVNAYALLFGGFLLLGGRAGDLMGRKRVFLAGLVLFTSASLLCALATGETWLILARGLQGLGAALVSPAALSIVTTTFREGAERTKALGVWAAIAVGGGAVGLVLGGFLVDVLSWPWIFFVNVPVGIVAFILSLRLVPESKDEHAHRSFDVAGAATVTGGLIALVYGIVRSAEAGWGSAEVLGFLALAAVLLVAFVLIERRSAEPLVRLSIFSVQDRARRERGDVRRRSRPLRDVLLQHALRAARARVLAARGGIRVRPVHRRGDRRGRTLAAARSGARRARGAPDRARARRGRAAHVPAPHAGQLVPDRPAPGDPPRVHRHGARLRPDHADRDERHPRRRRGARVRPLQHVAADRRRARPRAPLDVRDEPDDGRALVARPRADAGRPGGGAGLRLPRRVGALRDLPARWPRCSSPCSCAAATWSRWPRARPRPPSRSAGEDSRSPTTWEGSSRWREDAYAAEARALARWGGCSAGLTSPGRTTSPSWRGRRAGSRAWQTIPSTTWPGDEEDHAEDDRGHEHAQCDEKSHVQSPSARVNGAYFPSGTMATWS